MKICLERRVRTWSRYLSLAVLLYSIGSGFGEEQEQIQDDIDAKVYQDDHQDACKLGGLSGPGCSGEADLRLAALKNEMLDDITLPIEQEIEGRSGRHRRQAVENDFEGTVNEDHLSDIYDPLKKSFNTYHVVEGGGYATNNRSHILRFSVDDPYLHYPPFTYRGFSNKNQWHLIPIQRFFKKRNRSFMLLNHECEAESVRAAEKECAKLKYPLLPNCSAFDQSPININLTKARDSSLKEFIYENLMDKKNKPIEFDFVMSLPFDGTDLLTVELLTQDQADPQTFNETGLPMPPSISKGSIVGKDLFLERIHIKYGINEANGSEHVMNGSQYGMELQFIFTKHGRNKKEQYWDILFNYYTTPSGIDERRKAVHLVSILVEVISDDQLRRTNINDTHYNKKASEAFQVLSNAARMFWRINSYPRQKAPIAPPPPPPGVILPHYIKQQPDWNYRAFRTKPGSPKLKLGHILPPLLARDLKYSADHSIYYHYKGTVTHPPCFGHVDWAIYDKPLKISRTMWQNFLYIPSEFDDTKFIAGNFRSPKDVYVLGLDKTLKTKDEINKTRIQIKAWDLRKSKRSRNSSEPNFKNPEDDYSDDDLALGSRLQPSLTVVSFLASVLVTLVQIL